MLLQTDHTDINITNFRGTTKVEMCWTTWCKIFSQWKWPTRFRVVQTLYNFRVAAACSYLALALIKSSHDLVQTHLQSLRLRPDVSLSYPPADLLTKKNQQAYGNDVVGAENSPVTFGYISFTDRVVIFRTKNMSSVNMYKIKWKKLWVIFKVVCRMKKRCISRGSVVIEQTLLVNSGTLCLIS